MPEKAESLDSTHHRQGVTPLELLISRLLIGGVVVSMLTVLLGLVLMFVHHPEYLDSAADLQRLTSPGAAVPRTVPGVVHGILALRGEAIVALGLLLLIATPIVRVAVSIVGFALQRDRIYVAISTAVLAILAISFLLGKAG